MTKNGIEEKGYIQELSRKVLEKVKEMGEWKGKETGKRMRIKKKSHNLRNIWDGFFFLVMLIKFQGSISVLIQI